MSRFNSWLNELQPEMFVELSPELAAERGIEHGGWLTVRLAARPDRGPGDGDAAAAAAARSRAASSTRSACRSTGASPARAVGGIANDLTSLVADPNVSMHEGKAFACQVARRPARRAEPPARRVPLAPWPTREPDPRHAGRRPAGREHPDDDDAAELELATLPQAADPPRGRLPTRWIGSSARSAAARPEPQPATGFFTDTTVCIGCKACEVACKQWNQLPADGFDWTGNSYDNTGDAVGHVLAARQVHRAVRRPPSRPSRP